MFKILGYVRRRGHSARTGRDYDFYEFSLAKVEADSGYNGTQCKVVSVSPEALKFECAVGDTVDVFYNEFGRVQSMSLSL